MIDLSFLTEEEQQIIREVLKRDAELKKADQQRIQNLQKTVRDRGLLRYMTGEWFYETKQLRHRERIHGTDIVRASMKQAQRPLTTLETTQVFSEKLPVLSGENEDVFIPPVARRSLQVVPGQRNNESSFTANSQTHLPCWEMVRGAPKAALLSPPKHRKNPFNSEAEDKRSHLRSGTVEGSLASYEGYTSAVDLSADLPGSANMHNAFVPPPVAENAAVSISRQDSAEVDRPGGGDSKARLPTASSTDLPAHLEPQNPLVHVSSTETWEDRKQVSLSSTDAPAGVAGWRDAEEAGEDRLLDMDRVAPTEAENGDLENSVRLDPLAHSQSAFDKERDDKNQELPEQEVAHHQLLHELQSLTEQSDASTEEDSGSTVHSETEEVCRSPRDGKAADVQPGYLVHQLPEQRPGVNPEAKRPREHSQNTGFGDENDKSKEAENTKSHSQGAASEGEDEPAVWVEFRTLQRTLFKETGTSADGEASHGPAVSSHSPQTTVTDMNTTDAGPGQDDPPQKDCGLDLSGEDGVYRAKPIVIYETGDSLTESQPQGYIFASVPSSQAFRNPSEEVNHSAPLPVFAVDSIAVGVSKQRDGEHTKQAPLSSTFLSTPSADSREMREEEGQPSPPKTNYSLSRSTGRSPLSSPDHQHQVEAHAQDRPPSPGKSDSPKLKRQKEEVRRSPSKTCHPRVLPRESTSPQVPRLPGSPLKAFPINIDPQTPEEHHGRPSPVPRKRRSPSHQAKQTVLADTRNLSDIPSSAALQPMKVSEKSLPSLARSCVPQDYQHYLGPHEKAFVPSFYQAKSTFADSSDPTEAIPSGVQVTAGKLNQGYQEASAPVKSPLKPMSSSKSMENLLRSGEERKKDSSREHMNESVDGDSPQMNASLSVPVLQLEETDSDSTFEPNLNRRNTSSSVSNFSLSSGMNSMSSISSISSIFPADVGDLEVQGRLQFAVNYIQKLGEFHVFVVNCRDLAVADVKKRRSDPYVKCYLLPDKSKLGKRKTSVKKKTSHPTFNEILRFKIPLEVLKSQNLNMSVWHNDTFGRNSFLGEVDVDLSEWDFSNTQINEYALQARASVRQPSLLPDQRLMDNRGQMRVAVRFLPQTSHSRRTSGMETGEVQIWVKDCKNLPPVRGVTIDPFVKCTVLPDTSRKSRQKTRVVKRTTSPMFNHTMVYDGFRTEDLREACVEITVWDHDRLHHHFIGGLRLGLGTGKSYGVDVPWMDSSSDEADLWQRMLQSGGEWVEDILPLRMLMLAKCK